MKHTTQKAGVVPSFSDEEPTSITPPNANKSPDTRKTSKYPFDLNLNLFKALFPYATTFDDGVDMALSDAHGFIVERVTGQVQLLQDLGNKIVYNEDLDGKALAFTAESINRQLAVLDLIHGEYYKQVATEKDQLKIKIGFLSGEIEALQEEIKQLKGGDL